MTNRLIVVAHQTSIMASGGCGFEPRRECIIFLYPIDEFDMFRFLLHVEKWWISLGNNSLDVEYPLGYQQKIPESDFADSMKQLPSDRTNSTKIPVALQEGLDVRPFLHRIHQSHQPRVILQPFSPLSRQTLIMANLIDHHIRICDVLPNDVRPRFRQLVGLQMCLQGI